MGFEGLIVGRSKSQQEIDAQIGRLADEFRKKESPAGMHELERDGAKKNEFRGIRGNMAGGRTSGPPLHAASSGGDENEKRNGPVGKEEERKITGS